MVVWGLPSKGKKRRKKTKGPYNLTGEINLGKSLARPVEIIKTVTQFAL
jgi:hypothetical protein